MHLAFEDIEHFKTEMVVFDPRVDVFIAIDLETVGGLLPTVEDAEVDVRPLCVFVQFGR